MRVSNQTYLKKLAMACLTGAACFGALLADSGKAFAANFGSISKIYAFGDSYSDGGESLKISSEAVAAGVPGASILPPFLEVYDPQGRWTNTGLTAVEVLAQRTNLGLTNYSVGGGKSGNGNLNSWLDAYQNTGLFGQIEQYKTQLNSVADSDALHFIFISTNDLLAPVFTNTLGSVESLASSTVDNIGEGVAKLASIGAKKFFVVNSTDLAVLPFFKNQPEIAASFRDTINQQLPNKLNALSQQLGIEVALYNHVAISDKIRSAPAQYGLTNIVDACQPLYSPLGKQPQCSNPDEYYFWDEIHPTRRTHQIIGEDMAIQLASYTTASVPEPSSILGIVVVGSALFAVRRRSFNF